MSHSKYVQEQRESNDKTYILKNNLNYFLFYNYSIYRGHLRMDF